MVAISASTGSREAFFIMSGCKLTDMSAPTTSEGAQEQVLTIRPENMVVNTNGTTQLYSPW